MLSVKHTSGSGAVKEAVSGIWPVGHSQLTQDLVEPLHSLDGETEALLQSSHSTLYDAGPSLTGVFSISVPFRGRNSRA